MRLLNDPLYKAPDPHETLQSLLEAVQAADGFVVPALSLAVPGGAPVATPKAERRIGPWLHRGLSQRQIDEALYRIRTENPGLDMGRATEELQRLYPQLFISETEMLAMNVPLPRDMVPLLLTKK